MNSTVDVMDSRYVGENIPEHSRIIFIVVGIIYVVLGVVGNLVIIVTIATTRSMRTPHYCFIANLALADLLITGYVLPWLVASLILRYYPVVNFSHCIANAFLTVSAYVASLLSLLAISLNRYLNICHNVLFQRIFSRGLISSLGGCGLIWFISFLCSLPCLTGWGRFIFDRKVHYCGYDRTYSFSYTLFLLLFSIGIPVVIIFLCNFAIWRHVRQASHRIYATRSTTLAPENGVTRAIASTSNDDNSHVMKNGTQGIAITLKSQKQKQSPTTVDSNSKGEAAPSVSTEKSTGKVIKVTNRLITRGELALMKTVFTVFVCFTVLMTPYMISTLLDTDDQWRPVVHMTCSFTPFTNSCINFILYGIMTPRFRNAFRSLFVRMGTAIRAS